MSKVKIANHLAGIYLSVLSRVLMKHLRHPLLLVLFASTCALADSPEAILKDYRKQATQAVERPNQSLERSVSPLIARLSQQGKEAEAELLTDQYMDKMAGDPVDAPLAEAVQIFTSYDEARSLALAPIKKSTITRIESQQKAAGGGKAGEMDELAKVREEVEAGKISKPLNFPSTWNCINRIDGTVLAVVTFLPDGRWRYTAEAERQESTAGKWTRAGKGRLTLKRRGAPDWILSFGKNTGVLRRPDKGVQFLESSANP